MKSTNDLCRILIAVIGLFTLLAPAADGAIPSIEREALLALYDSTSGDQWINNSGWGGEAGTECSWYGVTCAAGETAVVGLDLSANNLAGTIPAEIADFTSLASLLCSHNQLSGQIPAELGELTQLSNLRLDLNQLSGEIPAELGNLNHLIYLWLDRNQLSGTIPAELGNLTHLTHLYLYVNQLSGEIPPELASLSQLQELYISSNQLTGDVPSTLGSLTNLTDLRLHNNQLTGEIPVALSNLAQLRHLVLSSNQLSGEIPGELESLSNLLSLYLEGNQLSGEIPAELGNLANLEALWLASNQLSGEIPAALGNLNHLQSLRLSANPLSGEIPVELGNLAQLEQLEIYSAQISGSIPTDLASLTALRELVLYDNLLTGEIPVALTALPSLERLDLAQNQLGGEFPAALGNLVSLQHLSLFENQFSGEIPSQLGNLSNLVHLDLGGNQLSGAIPAEIWTLSHLRLLRLYDNQLTGSIPPELGNLLDLMDLHLGLNQLSGEIPPEIALLTQLGILNLSYNELSGPIPAGVWDLTEMRHLFFRGNDLVGGIPSEIGNLVNLEILYLYDTQLGGEIPPEIGNLTKLSQLYLFGNQHMGEIPPELGNLTSLLRLGVHNNQLTGPIPSELGNLSSLLELTFSNNQLAGPIPSELGSLSNLQVLTLSGNRLAGTVPVELGNLSDLEFLRLNSNALDGPLPAELLGLTSLVESQLDLRWNKFWTDNDVLADFLDSKQVGNDWRGTQTVPPTDATTGEPESTSIPLTWTPIAYTANEGGYRVSFATSPGGPYAHFATTANKTAAGLVVDGLVPNTSYCFIVETLTDVHGANQNALISIPSVEVCDATESGPSLTIDENIPFAVDSDGKVPVVLDTNGDELVAVSFSVDFDAGCLAFDPADGDGDGIPDAVLLPGVPAGYAVTIFYDSADTDGEIDVLIHDPALTTPLDDGELVTITLTATCAPPVFEPIVAPVDFSSDPTPTFSDAQANAIEGSWRGGSMLVIGGLRGDCQADGGLGSVDVVAGETEIRDGDGEFWVDTPGGTFTGSPVGCDSNADSIVNAADIACTIRLIFGLPCGGHDARRDSRPSLMLPYELIPESDGSVLLRIEFDPAGHSITSTFLSLDLDTERLTFSNDPGDARLLGTPMSIFSVSFDSDISTGEIGILIADFAAEPGSLTEGVLIELRLDAMDDQDLSGAVTFGSDPTVSFGDMEGRSVAGDGVVDPGAIFVDGFEAGDCRAWSAGDC